MSTIIHLNDHRRDLSSIWFEVRNLFSQKNGRGWYRLCDRIITVRREDGLTKYTQIGGSEGREESLARMIMCEPDIGHDRAHDPV